MDPQSPSPVIARMPFRRTRAPATAFAKVVVWLSQATKFAATALNADKPNDSLLLEALDEWWIGFAGRPEISQDHCRSVVRVTFDKPRGEGPTTRDFDPALLAFAMLLCAPGGRLALEEHGPGGGYYYIRLYITGERPDGQRRRVYLLRLAADTPPDRKTKEPTNFRSALRQDLGTYQQDPDNEPTMALYGTSEAKQDSVDRWRELEMEHPGLRPAGIGADDFATLLNLAHYLLRQLPLGQDAAA
ncbi:hypothetical protein [Methylobacterium sp. WL120]|uniref:hypothetical protein n=1 Tax=Methylobacterium sp. WL120 TaxID=2603887 RepID=UPI0011C794EC|nr:hypothetical protein [Methylobacterium sp. WL120]TXM69975.1 hypothetical protein FV229_03820 [Methylobacterium sp. WL120]